MCGYSCQIHPNDCGSMENNIYLLSGLVKPATGQCYPPAIENGKVLNSGMLNLGDKLEIECDPGFDLIGKENYCVLQNMYGPDSRIMQACIKLEGEEWNGNGRNYNGRKSTTLQLSPCENWKEVVATGSFNPTRLVVAYGRAAMRQGSKYNHNLCRNPGGKAPVPWCFASDIDLSVYGDMEIVFDGMERPEDDIIKIDTSEVMYCENLPLCGGDFCSNAVNDPIMELFCYSADPLKDCSMRKVQNEWMQRFCPRMCCSEASKCPETPAKTFFDFGLDFGIFGGFGDDLSDSSDDSGDDFGDFGGDEDFSDFGGDEDFGDFGGEEDFGDFGGDEDFGDFGGDEDFGDFGGDEDFGDFGGDEDFGDFGGDEDFGDFGGDEDFGDFGGDEDFGDFGGDEDFGDFGGDEDFSDFVGDGSFGDDGGDDGFGDFGDFGDFGGFDL